jgi:hypothetical protein
MGVAGSLANLTVEAGFHFFDTVNIRSKAAQGAGGQITMLSMVNKIWQKEGLYGFSKGFSACFYGAAACGFIYFSMYKYLKDKFKDKFGIYFDIGVLYMTAAIMAETATLSVKYPYDLIKCRL